MEIQVSPKIIFYIIGSVSIVGLLWAVFKFIIIKFFENILDTLKELIIAKNDHADRIKAIETSCEIRHDKKEYEKGFIE